MGPGLRRGGVFFYSVPLCLKIVFSPIKCIFLLMFIQTEDTPNPATLKFLPGRVVMAKGTAEFRALAETDASPLARRLLSIDGIEGVFFGHDFVSVTKREDREWVMLKPHILGALMEHFTIGGPAVNG